MEKSDYRVRDKILVRIESCCKSKRQWVHLVNENDI